MDWLILMWYNVYQWILWFAVICRIVVHETMFNWWSFWAIAISEDVSIPVSIGLCYIISYYIILYYITLYYITLHYITLYYIILYCIVLYQNYIISYCFHGWYINVHKFYRVIPKGWGDQRIAGLTRQAKSSNL